MNTHEKEAIRFDGQVAIITGAGKGLGRAYAEYLAARGARIVVNNRRRPEDIAGAASADLVVQAICSAGGEAIANYASVDDPRSGLEMVAQALATWGRLDILINNAGIDQGRTFHKLTLHEFEKIFAVNFHGTLYATHAAYAHMRKAGYGRILVSTSSAGLHGGHGLSAYAASKSAVLGLMRSLAAEGAPHNVLSNAISPYAFSQMTAAYASEEFKATMKPERVAPMVAYLVSSECGSNGRIIVGGKGWFRRAAMLEGAGAGYASSAELTPEALRRDMPLLCDMSGAREFDDALSSFEHFFASM